MSVTSFVQKGAVAWRERLLSIAPGLALAMLAALAAQYGEAKSGQPSLIIALILGFMLHPFEVRLDSGLNFAAKRVLEIGIVLLGFRVSFAMLATLGLSVVLVVIGAVVATLVLTLVLALALRLDLRMGILAGGATAICGSSACLAIAAILPRDRAVDQMVMAVVVSVTLLSTLAMAVYPAIAVHAGLNAAQAGVFLGGSIHNVPQAIGAGYIVSPQAGDAATIVKLLRVMMLMPVTMSVAVAAPLILRGGAKPSAILLGKLILPWFIVAYFIALLVSSAGVVPQAWTAFAETSSHFCLVVAVAAIGAKTSIRGLFRSGLRPIALVLFASCCLGGMLFAVAAYGWI